MMSQIATHNKLVLLVNFSKTPNLLKLQLQVSFLLLISNLGSSLNSKRLVEILMPPKTRPMTRIIKVLLPIARRLEGNKFRLLRNKKRKKNWGKKCSRKTKNRNRSKKKQWNKGSRNSRSKQKQIQPRLRNSKIYSSKRSKWQRKAERTVLHLRHQWLIATRETNLNRIWLSSQQKLVKLTSLRWSQKSHVETKWFKLSRNSFWHLKLIRHLEFLLSNFMISLMLITTKEWRI